MPAIASPRNGIDRKLHLIALKADSSESGSLLDLARLIAKEKTIEFSYRTEEGIRFSNAYTVAAYGALARALGVLDENLDCVRKKMEVKSLDNFQVWLGELTMEYLTQHQASPTEVARVSAELIASNPSELPIIETIHNRLDTDLHTRRLRHCLQIVALLRSKLLVISSKRLYLSPDVFRT